jgi:ribosome-binding protein aMBF1 (putative translation factor)
MKHQDWTPVVFNKTTKPSTTTRTIQNRNTQDQKSKEMYNYDPETIQKPKTWPQNIRSNVQKLRQLHKLTQEQLAKKLNIQPSVIKNIENGQGMYDGKIVHKINQTFHTSLDT